MDQTDNNNEITSNSTENVEKRAPAAASSEASPPTEQHSKPVASTTDATTPPTTPIKPSGKTKSSSKSSISSPSTPPSSGTKCIIFYSVTYLGCSTVKEPKSEAEITRIMATLNEQASVAVEVTMSVPQLIEESIILYEKNNTEHKIAEYKMSHVMFVVRGDKNSPESSCFAFTTCHGDSIENATFSCHVFRCDVVEAVSKILYSFWVVFNRTSQQNQQNQQQQQQQQQQQIQPKQHRDSTSSGGATTTTSSQISSVASSLLNSLYVSLNTAASSSSAPISTYSTGAIPPSSGAITSSSAPINHAFADYALKYCNGRAEDQYIFRAIVEIKEESSSALGSSSSSSGSSSGSYVSVPRDKDFFKLRKNLDKQVHVQLYQMSGAQTLEIERCFGLLMCPGRNVSHKDMQLLQTVSMGKSAGGASGGYVVCARWDPRDPSYASALQVLNEETQKNARVFLTIAVDLVIAGLQDPVRFCIETKARIYPQNEKFWVYQKTKHVEEFYLQIVKVQASSPKQRPQPRTTSSSSSGGSSTTDSAPSSPITTPMLSLQNIHSQAELVRKQQAVEHMRQQEAEAAAAAATPAKEDSEEDDEMVMSGLGQVSKDCAQEDLSDWGEILKRWRSTTWQERPRGLTALVRKGIPEALRGEVWQLLTGCYEDEKSMNETYRLLLSRDSPSEQVIVRDVNRTFPGHQFFQDESGQQALYKLSKAYSIYDEEVGYCQGLSFLIASLLLHVPEEQAFNLLVKIMYKYGVREIYKTNFESLHLRFYQLESLMRDHLPELYEHFVDLNIEPHMYASQWFLTLYTAKFPLYMVFRILDLFLCEGFLVVFSIALALLKCAQRDLLVLDFEGVLKYFRVNMPKRYRNEANFRELMQVWPSVHAKVSDKKLAKYEKSYREELALKEDPLVRYERECKRLMQLARRLEMENDDLANEYIDAKLALNKQVDELRDENESARAELVKYKGDYQARLHEASDTNKRLLSELDQVKQLWRREAERYESECERNQIIINEYKQICNSLSARVERWDRLKARGKHLALCGQCSEANKVILQEEEQDPSSNDSISETTVENTILDSAATAQNNDEAVTEQPTTTSKRRIKELELELARVKLELVDAQCKNQEYGHKLKGILENNSNSHIIGDTTNNIKSSSSQNSLESSSGSDLQRRQQSLTSANNNYSSSQGGQNNWLSKTFSQLKETTNQVIKNVKSSTDNTTSS